MPRLTPCRATLALTLGACAGTASAADWIHRGEPDGTRAMQVDRIVRAGDAIVLVDPPWWQRVTDITASVAYVGPVSDAVPYGDGVLTQDGCDFTLRDAFGHARWTIADPPDCRSPFAGQVDRRAPLDGEQALWVAEPAPSPAYRVLADGQRRAVPAPDGLRWSVFSPVPSAPAAYAIGTGDRTVLARIEPGGVQWSVALPPDYSNLATTADGDALVSGHAATAAGPRLRTARYAPDGRLRWERTYADMPATYSRLRVLADGRHVIGAMVLDPDARTYSDGAVYAYAGDGTPAWTRLLPGGAFGDFVRGRGDDPRMAPAHVDFIQQDPFASGSGAVTFVRLDRDGGEVVRRQVAGRPSVATAAADTIGVVLRPSEVEFTRGPASERYLPTVPRESLLLRGVLADDGAGFALAAVSRDSAAFHALQLTEIGADGRRRWEADVHPFASPAAATAIVNNADRVCIGPLRAEFEPLADLHCVRRSDGSALFTTPMGEPTLTLPARHALPAMRMRIDGGIELLEAESCTQCGPRIFRGNVNAAGTRTGSRLLGFMPGAPIAAAMARDGRVALVAATEDRTGELARVTLGTLDGEDMLQTTEHAIPPVLPGSTLELLPDTGVLLHARHADGAALYRFGPDRLLRWTRTLAGRALVAVGADVVLVAEDPGDAAPHAGRLDLLELDTGASRWMLEEVRQDGIGAVAIDAANRHVLVVHGRRGAMTLARRRLEDGSTAGAQAFDCPDALRCDPFRVQAHGDGDVRLFAQRIDPRMGRQLQLARAAPPAAAAVGQPGLSGTWYAPDAAGQGVVLEYSEQRQQLLGGWFTYAAGGRHVAADQRWYSLQANVLRGAAAAELAVYAGSGAAFGTGAAALRPVGRAVLTLVDCDDALLTYAFDAPANGGVTGEMPLRRLTAAPHACTDATGTTQPSAATSTVAGLRRGQWGAWFDPATPGQGLLFDLRPPTAGDPGQLAGGWFTYDVDGADDDPDRQHWFLLQGDLAAAHDGMLTVPLFQALGGGFDRDPTRNVVRVGDVTLRFDGCERATLDYRFDDTSVAGPYAGRRGTVPLAKLAPCAEP